MKINELGLSLLKKWEGLRLTVYADIAGNPTVGYGHMDHNLKVGATIDLETANELLEEDLENFELGISDIVTVPLNSNQFSALVVLAYNVGLGKLPKQTLITKLNKADYTGAAACFTSYVNAGGKFDKGLLNRRLEEKALFLTPVSSDSDPLTSLITKVEDLA